MSYAIGIDIGTTNSKVVLCELPDCRPVRIDKFESPKFVEGQQIDYDVNSLVAGILKLLKGCTDALGDRSSEVEFVSVASVGESGVLVRPNGSFGDRSIFWYDQRGASYAAQVYEQGYAERLYQITGIPAHSSSALFKIMWLRDHGESLEGAVWLPMADFVAWYLCGELGQDQTLASRTSVLDIRTNRTSREVCERFGVPEGLFPQVVPSGTPRGTLRRAACEATGLPGTCKVCVSGHDHMSGSVACALEQGAEMLNSTGTSEGILLLDDAPRLDEGAFCRNLTNGRYVFDDTFSFYSSVPTAGFSFEWTLGTMGIEESDFFGPGQDRLYRRYLDGDFEDTGVLFVPHLRGSGPPHRNASAAGAFYGLRDTTTRDDVLYGLHLGVCLELRALLESMMDPGAPRPAAKVIGPAVKNPLWMQMKADVLGVPVTACDVQEAVARGAVLVAARRLGLDVKARFESETYLPDARRAERLNDVFVSKYRPLTEALASLER